MAINPAIAGGGVVLTAAAVGGGLYAGGVIGSSQQTPRSTPENNVVTAKWHALSDDSDYTGAYTGKYGETYGKYLVGVATATTSKTPQSNSDWWQQTYNKKYKKAKVKPTDGFANLETSQKLQEACKDAYGADSAATEVDNVKKLKVTKAGSPQTIAHFKEDEFWAFCSSGGTKIMTIKDKGQSGTYTVSDSYGQKSGNDAKLVSVEDEGNGWFWKLRQAELEEDTTIDTESTSEFKKLKDRLKSKTASAETPSTLKALCKVAYGKTESTDGYSKAHVFKFCSLKGSE